MGTYTGHIPIRELEPLECFVIAQRVRASFVIYLYPFDEDAFKYARAKVVTRDGRKVTKITIGTRNGVPMVMGLLDGEELVWDIAGRFYGMYRDSEKDLYIPERYFYRDAKTTLHLSYPEWYEQFPTKHPDVKIPKKEPYVDKTNTTKIDDEHLTIEDEIFLGL